MTRPLLPGTYGCVQSSSTLGWLIGHGTASPYAHAFIVIDGATVIEARPGGVGYADLGKYLRADAVLNDEEPLTEGFRAAVVARATALLDAPYDWAAIGDLAARSVPFIGGYEKSAWLPVGQKGRYICSQICSAVYTDCGFSMYPERDRWTVSPRSLADRITRRIWLPA